MNQRSALRVKLQELVYAGGIFLLMGDRLFYLLWVVPDKIDVKHRFNMPPKVLNIFNVYLIIK